MEFKITADSDTAFMELQAGTIDILDYLTSAQQKAAGDDCEILQGNMNMVQGMFFNHEYEPQAENLYPYDPEKTKSLLAEAGYPDGFDLEITATTASTQYLDEAVCDRFFQELYELLKP